MRNSGVTTVGSGQEMLSADFLTQLERLSLLSRRSFRGRVKGERRSPRKGISVEFSDFRPYGIGDDLRYVDWNVYARLDRLYLKLFVDEEDLCLHLLVDASASMGFGAPSKLDHAARLAGALGFVGLVGLERVGVGVLRERMAEGFSPARGRSQVLSLMNFLGRLTPGGSTSLNEVTIQCPSWLERRRGRAWPQLLDVLRVGDDPVGVRRPGRARGGAGGEADDHSRLASGGVWRHALHRLHRA